MPNNHAIQKQVAKLVKGREFSNEEWNLEKIIESITIIMFIAKETWVCHCRRCNADHKIKKIKLESNPK